MLVLDLPMGLVVLAGVEPGFQQELQTQEPRTPEAAAVEILTFRLVQQAQAAQASSS